MIINDIKIYGMCCYLFIVVSAKYFQLHLEYNTHKVSENLI